MADNDKSKARFEDIVLLKQAAYLVKEGYFSGMTVNDALHEAVVTLKQVLFRLELDANQKVTTPLKGSPGEYKSVKIESNQINQEIYDLGQSVTLFNSAIKKAYDGRSRPMMEAANMLQCEAAELAEIFLKYQWYHKEYTDTEVLSEAGDILNFLTYILQCGGFTLEDAMNNNISKLKERGWI